MSADATASPVSAHGEGPRIATEILTRMYRSMVRIRVLEERVADLLVEREIRCPTHLYTGQEAIAAGVCAALERDDYVFGGHRSHGHYLAKGGDLRGLMAELYGKETGCARGRGGSMHLVAPEVGILGTVPIVAATIPMAVGTALAARLRGERRISVSFFGDGAVEEGAFHESMNLAAGRRLPVVFICENNGYSSHLHVLERRARDNIVQSAEAHGMPGRRLDGNDAQAVYHAATQAVARARRGDGPSLLECRTFRWRGHVGPALDLDVGVQRRDELLEWRERDPIPRLRSELQARGLTSAELDRSWADAQNEVEDAVAFARASALPDPRDLGRYVFSPAERGAG
jgi:pyruvate dehydrogenase E1 component alpha subunit